MNFHRVMNLKRHPVFHIDLHVCSFPGICFATDIIFKIVSFNRFAGFHRFIEIRMGFVFFISRLHQ